jgi:hypothetical protein
MADDADTAPALVVAVLVVALVLVLVEGRVKPLLASTCPATQSPCSKSNEWSASCPWGRLYMRGSIAHE